MLDTEDLAARVDESQAIREFGFVPVPILAVRRLTSEAMLREFLAALQSITASGSILVVGGDPAQPLGPYPDATSVIVSGVLEEYGVREVGVAGHPGGHPAVASDVLWLALTDKAAMLIQRDLRANVVTQFGFDADQVLAWLAQLRSKGINLPARVGVPGPARARTLLSYAARCGVNTTTAVLENYGFPRSNSADTVGPERFLRKLISRYDPQLHGTVGLHFNTFAGFATTARWINQFAEASQSPC